MNFNYYLSKFHFLSQILYTKYPIVDYNKEAIKYEKNISNINRWFFIY